MQRLAARSILCEVQRVQEQAQRSSVEAVAVGFGQIVTGPNCRLTSPRAGSVFGSRRPALPGSMRTVPVHGCPSVCPCLSLSARVQISRQHAPCPHLGSSVLGCGLPEKGSGKAGVVVGVRGAGKTDSGRVNVCRLVPGPGGVRFCLGYPVGHSP